MNTIKASDLDLIPCEAYRIMPKELKDEIDMRGIGLQKLRECIYTLSIDQWFNCSQYGLIIRKSTSRFSLCSTYTCADHSSIVRNQLELGL